jgi:hypothetical protein
LLSQFDVMKCLLTFFVLISSVKRGGPLKTSEKPVPPHPVIG